MLTPFESLLATLVLAPDRARLHRKEDGFSTAELVGNAALGITALVAIWGLLQVVGVDVVNWIRSSIVGGAP